MSYGSAMSALRDPILSTDLVPASATTDDFSLRLCTEIVEGAMTSLWGAAGLSNVRRTGRMGLRGEAVWLAPSSLLHRMLLGHLLCAGTWTVCEGPQQFETQVPT